MTICIDCKHEFEPVYEKQPRCIPCKIIHNKQFTRPYLHTHKELIPKPTSPKLPKIVKFMCSDCHQEFVKTGNGQLRCSSCAKQ